MANFSFLSGDEAFRMFAGACIEAEEVFGSSPTMCAVGCRKALELAVHWVFAAEETFEEPSPRAGMRFADLQLYLHEPHFAYAMFGEGLEGRLQFIVKLGNQAVHTPRAVKPLAAEESLRNLFDFVQWVARAYGAAYEARVFDAGALPEGRGRTLKRLAEAERLLAAQGEEIARLEARAAELMAARVRHEAERAAVAPSASEAETRKVYIDLDLQLAGWTLEGPGRNVEEEKPIRLSVGGKAQQGYADYVLNGADGKPLAVVEAKRCGKDPRAGESQAELYADGLERATGQRPVIFLTNGFVTLFWDKREGPPRRVSGIFGPEDLLRRLQQREARPEASINAEITDRPYQLAAIEAVRKAIAAGKRKHLLVMATGTGKTRTAASLVDVLARSGRVTRVLFLADRLALVRQAKESFQKHLPDLSLCNLTEAKERANWKARVVFATYQTMQHAIDGMVHRKTGARKFTPAHFDLIVVDESHRSIFNKYRAIFDYFDGQLVGLTATPRRDVDKNTYLFFGMAEGVPTYAYDYRTAVEEDHVLVPYVNHEVALKILTEGARYDELSEEEKARYEAEFAEDGVFPEVLPPNEMLSKILNVGTIDLVLKDLMERGIRVEGGERLGKTVIFAQTSEHARLIKERFDVLFPEYQGLFARCVLCVDDYAQTVIDRFRQEKPEPQIAISVDMMDTGIDVPEIVNLVFFKRVRSRVKFWQMIGRGTRLCPNLRCVDAIDGEYLGKRRFCIFDYCGNFDYFREHTEEVKGGQPLQSLTEKAFGARVRLIQLLQGAQGEEAQAWREELVAVCTRQLAQLTPERFEVKPHLEAVARFRQEEAWAALSGEAVRTLTKEIAPIVPSLDAKEDDFAKRFDLLIFSIQKALLEGTNAKEGARKALGGLAARLLEKRSISAVHDRESTLERVRSDAFWANPSGMALEAVRKELRDLIGLLKDDTASQTVVIHLMDVVLWQTVGNTLAEGEEIVNTYKERVEHFIRLHRDDIPAISKLWHNEPLTEEDFRELQRVLVEDFTDGAQEYAATYQNKELGLMVREVVGLESSAAVRAFADFVNVHRLSPEQIDFVDRLIQHVETHGYVETRALQAAPFTHPTPILSLFHASAEQDDLFEAINALRLNALAPTH